MDTFNTIKIFDTASPLALDGGGSLGPIDVAYETWGSLNATKSNVMLLCHALTGDQFAAGDNPVTGKKGWWDRLIGPDKLFDTNRFFIVCSNVLGSCYGTTGPSSRNPVTNDFYGTDFPVLTIRDMVRVQHAFLKALDIDHIALLVGGSMGGMQVLEWLATYPFAIGAAIIIASSDRHSAQNIALHEVGRQAIMADPDWQNGFYYQSNNSPQKGLSVARMTAHITYLSEEALARKFGRNLQDRNDVSFGFDADFQVESYLRYQGRSFVDRFDANSYLYITRAMDYLDIASRFRGNLGEAFSAARSVETCVLSITSDWLYPTADSRRLVKAMTAAGLPVSFAEITSDAGHDAFLLETPDLEALLTVFVNRQADKLSSSAGGSFATGKPKL